ncbi:aminotransferase class IV family protein [Winogradskya consettensis]|uniref:Aminotransferase n=1 Tax=Winogradskya consettensis TaxID=113560 RepID=A0A919VRT7_9ACTN|nr:aminotransferase class IV [Actinoplanes consettensis]GIM73195.1 hypothetical protein Aco04nite_34100 [Actinoplanes consettensis]
MAYVEINGAPADAGALHRVATGNYGHFTSMQVRDRAATGLTLHLQRLRAASASLFPDVPVMADEQIRSYLDHALRAERDASVRVTVVPGARGTDVMVSVSAPVADVTLPALRVRTIQYERELPHLKHVATMGLTYHLLQARRAGFDDVLFAGRDGLLREGSVWNAAFWDGERVVWPDAPMLAGITMQVLRIALQELRIPDEVRPLTSPGGMSAAAAVNSQWPAQPIAAIDETVFTGGDELTGLLRRAWDVVPWEPIS